MGKWSVSDFHIESASRVSGQPRLITPLQQIKRSWVGPGRTRFPFQRRAWAWDANGGIEGTAGDAVRVRLGTPYEVDRFALRAPGMPRHGPRHGPSRPSRGLPKHLRQVTSGQSGRHATHTAPRRPGASRRHLASRTSPGGWRQAPRARVGVVASRRLRLDADRAKPRRWTVSPRPALASPRAGRGPWRGPWRGQRVRLHTRRVIKRLDGRPAPAAGRERSVVIGGA